MSFRRKLSLFLVAMVMIPMVVVGVLLVRVSEDSREGKADARLASGLETAQSLYDESLQAAPDEARRIAARAGAELQASDRAALQRLAEAAVAGPAAVSVEIIDSGGETLASVGPEVGLAAAETSVTTGGTERIGIVRVTTLTSRAYLGRITDLTSFEAALAADRGVIASTTTAVEEGDVPDPGEGDGSDVSVGADSDAEFRAASLALDGAPPGARVALFTPAESGFVASQPVVAGILIVFFAAAFFMIALLLRNLQGRVATMLEAARRIGEGKFDVQVPVQGDDEMAGLAIELNRMSERLSDQMSQLQRQRRELDGSVKRIGEAFASGLDRDALLEVVVETAVSACDAQVGRAVLHDRPGDLGILSTEDLQEGLDGVLRKADEAAFAQQGSGTAADGSCHAIAHAMVDRSDRDRVLCTMAVAREGRPFSADESEVLRYLIGQTAISIENIGLHELVSEQAVTDELTGVPNHRHFSDWIGREVARVERFGGELSLVLIDIDDFKAVNDTHGHQQGDRVLAEVGRVLRLESRGVDEAARYGGEEFVLALPETGTNGAIEVAERLRSGIAGMTISPGGHAGEPITVTASLGVATMSGAATNARTLIAAADAALYRAKRSGKNRVVAGAGNLDVAPSSQGKGAIRRS